MTQETISKALMQQLLKIGSSLSSEKDIDQLLENILQAAIKITNADAGTLYRVTDEKFLKFEILHTKSKGVHLGGKSGNPISIPSLPLFKEDGSPDLARVVCYAHHKEETVNIPDAYNAEGFDFAGTHKFDAANNYRSVSFLTVPMKNHESEIIGVLQLINATDPVTGNVIPFSADSQEIVEALSSQAAVALTNRLLMLQLEELFEAFIGLINHAIDDKSPYTGGHCNRVPELTMMLADAVNRCSKGPLSEFTLSEGDRQELKIAGLLHDCGKITTPVHVVDKATKLEKIFDRISLIEVRTEVVLRDIQIAKAQNLISESEADERCQQLIDDFNFLSHCNIGGEFMKDPDVQRVRDIAKRYIWKDLSGEDQPFLSEEEITNLTIRAGTLNNEERKIINHHIDLTISMLENCLGPSIYKMSPSMRAGTMKKWMVLATPKG